MESNELSSYLYICIARPPPARSLGDCRIWWVETSCHKSSCFLCLAWKILIGLVFFILQFAMFKEYSLSDCRIWLVETSCHNSPHFLCLAENPDGVVFFTIQVSMFKDSPSVSIGSLQLATKKTLFTSPRDYCTPSIFFVRPLDLISENDTHNLPGYRDIFKAFRLQFKLIIHVVTLI